MEKVEDQPGLGSKGLALSHNVLNLPERPCEWLTT
jgi:hypothetical protein